jgi:hypothetical protein
VIFVWYPKHKSRNILLLALSFVEGALRALRLLFKFFSSPNPDPNSMDSSRKALIFQPELELETDIGGNGLSVMLGRLEPGFPDRGDGRLIQNGKSTALGNFREINPALAADAKMKGYGSLLSRRAG